MRIIIMARFSWRKWFTFETDLSRRERLRARFRPRVQQLEGRRRRFLPSVEVLEDRLVPAILQTVAGGEISVQAAGQEQSTADLVTPPLLQVGGGVNASEAGLFPGVSGQPHVKGFTLFGVENPNGGSWQVGTISGPVEVEIAPDAGDQLGAPFP
jgi:hypothetical protein